MRFKNLADRMEYLKGLYDDRLSPGIPVLAMVDGHRFSKVIKDKFEFPYSNLFISLMNQTAEYVASRIQGCKCAYTQSDEITFFITDYDTPETESYFGYRKCKLLSIIASYATYKFNDLLRELGDEKLIEEHLFDCKVWNMTQDDSYSYFVYRQNDCIRNSISQLSRSIFNHLELENKTSQERLKMLQEKGKSWEELDQGIRYGRLIYKELKEYSKILDTGETIIYHREKIRTHPAPIFKDDNILKTIIYG